jgi:hypothetical protein
MLYTIGMSALTIRARFLLSKRFPVTDDFREFVKSYVPDFRAGQWREISEVITDLFILLDNREADLIKIARPLIDKGGKSERLIVSKEAADWFRAHEFSDPGTCLEVAYRCHQVGKPINRLVIKLPALIERRDKLMAEKQAKALEGKLGNLEGFQL